MSGLFDDVLKRGAPPPAKPTDPPASSPAGVRLFDDVLQRDPNLPPLPPIDVPVEMSGNGNIPLRPQDREVGRIYTDKRGQPRRWMGDSWAFGDAARETTPMELFEGGYNDLIQGFTRAPEALIDLGFWSSKIFNPFEGLSRRFIPGYAENVDAQKAKVTRFFNEARAGYEQFKPAAYQAEQAKPVVLRDAEGNIDGFNLPSGETLLGTTMQTAPQIPQMIVGGGGARNFVAKVLPEASPLLQGFLGYGAANSALVAPNAAEQARVEALDAGATPEQANQAANTTMAMTAPLTFATGGAGEGLAAVQGQGSRNLLTALIRGFATDAPAEGVEEAGQSVIGDIAQGREINTANALEQGIIAAFAGGTPGAAIAGAEHVTNPRTPAIPAPPTPAAPINAPVAPTAAPAAQAAPDVLAELDQLLTRNVIDEPRPAAPAAPPPVVPPQAPPPIASQAKQSPKPAPTPSYGPNGLAAIESVGNNYRAPLETYTRALYRETSPDRALMLMPDSGVRGDEARGELFFSNTPDGARGQGGNTGVLMEFDSAGIDGNVNRDKPAWEASWQNGLAEFRTRNLSESAVHRALKAVTVLPGAELSPRFQRTLDRMLSRGWSEIPNADGSVTYSRDAGVGPTIEKTIASTRPRNQVAVKPRGEGGRPLDLLEVIANTGGLNREAWIREGVDPAEAGRRVGFGYLFRKEGGMTPDDLREMMQENGYLPRDSESGVATVDNGDAIDLLDRALRGGEKIYADDQGDALARYRATQRADDEAYREEIDRQFMDEIRADPEFAAPQGADDSFDWFDNDPIAAEYAQRVADLTEQAYSMGATDEQIIGAAFDSTTAGENIAKLEDIIGGIRNDRAQAVPEAARSNREGGAQPRETNRQAAGRPDFQLDAAPAAEPAAPQRVAQPGLFAPPTTREQVSAREKAVDAERNGLGRDAVPASRGDGELFSGPRPEQQRIDPGSMFNDYNPNASQIESRVEGDQVITENRLTRRILDATLGNADSVNAGLLLDNLSLQPDLRDEQRDLARRLAPVLKRLKVKLTNPPEGAAYAGAYDNGNNSMWILQADPDTVLHEGIHGATSALIASREARTNPTVRKAVAELEDMLAHLRMQVAMDMLTPPPEVRRLLDDRQGPLSNAKELIAYSMTEKPLQEWLATVPPPPGREQSRNVWQAFKDTIAKLFNLAGKTRSYLDALIETTGELIDFAGANTDVTNAAQAEVSGRYVRDPQRAFHGTPHKVDRFTTDRIGTGEGNQAYGWGLYFASMKNVADYYRGGLGKGTASTDELRPKAIAALKRNDILGFDTVGEALAAIRTSPDFDQLFDIPDAKDVQALREYRNSFGNLYEVNVPENDDLLDWDATLSEQPPKVREKLAQAFPDYFRRGWMGSLDGMPAPDAKAAGASDERLRAVGFEIGNPADRVTGQQFYRAIAANANGENHRQASKMLNDIGIPGLRYLDKMSRAGGEGTRNFVVWDDAVIGDPAAIDAARLNRSAASDEGRADSTSTPAFRAWFGKSKVVDADGNPRVVYHGANAKFDAFDPTKIGSLNGRSEGPGFYFTTDKSVASMYRDRGADGSLREVYLRIEKPMRYDHPALSRKKVADLLAETARQEMASDPDLDDWHDGFLANYVYTPSFRSIESAAMEAASLFDGSDSALDQISGIIGGGVPARTVNAAVKKTLGFDGYVSTGFSNAGKADNTIYVAMEPSQIKSTSNRGTFDPGDDRMDYARMRSYSKPPVQEDPQTQTPEFRRWFGESKAVDENGRPLIVYHGSPDARFMGEDATFMSMTDRFGERKGVGAFWFARDRATAASYADDRRAFDYQNAEAGIIPAYLKMENPLIVDGAGKQWRDAQSRGKTSNVIDEAIAGGYDGVIIRNVRDDYTGLGKGSETRATDTYVVFNSRQIKSANRNSGAFDPENPRIDAARIKRTPEQEAAMTKAGMPPDSRSVAQRSADALRSAWTKTREAMGTPDSRRQALVDRFHGLRAAEAQVPGITPEESPYIAARLTTGLPSIMESIMTFGAPKWDNGVLSIEQGTKGLLDALKPVANDLDAWLGWMVGRRAKLLKAQGRENLFTDADIDALLSLSKGRDVEFATAARDYLKIKNSILDVAEQAGLIDPVARAAWDHAEYVPFYRDDAGDTVGPGTRKGLEGQSSGIRALKGGDSNLSDPMANIIRNFTKLVDASMKNRAMLLAVDNLGASMFTKAGPDFVPALIPMDQVKKTLIAQGVPQSVIAGMPQSALKGVQSMLSIKPPSGDDVVRVMRKGKAEYYQVADPIVLRALTAFRQQAKHPAVQPLIFAKRLLTTGVTTTAEFVGANFIRDTAATWVIGDKKIRLGIDAANGVVRTLMTDQATKDMMAGGGSFIAGNFYGGDPDATAASLRRALRAKGLRNADIETFVGTVARTPLILWDKWHKLSSAIENSNRNAVYRRAIESGKPKIQAVYEAKDLMDFSMIGDSNFIQFFADVLPFFNARVQGLYKLGRAAADPKARRQIAARGAMIALASVALWYWNVTQYGDGYDELEEWDKDTYWHIAPGTRWHIRIPKPFEIGVLFATAPERMAQAISGNDRSDQSWDSLWRNLTGTLAMNPIPQAFLPIIEQWANRKFFTGRPIESMSDEKLLPEAREEWFTSDTMKLIADAVGNQTGASAKRLEHLWTGYTAGLGTYVLDASDWIVRKAQNTPSRPSMTPSEMPVLGRFWRGDAQPKNTRYVTEFYNLREQMQQVSGTIKEYIDNGQPEKAERLKKKYAWLLGDEIESKRAKGGIMFQNVREMEKMVRTLGEQRRDTNDFIEFRDATGSEKREAVDDNLLSRNSQMRFMVRKLREAQRQQGG